MPTVVDDLYYWSTTPTVAVGLGRVAGRYNACILVADNNIVVGVNDTVGAVMSFTITTIPATVFDLGTRQYTISTLIGFII